MNISNSLKNNSFRIKTVVIITISVSLFHLIFKPFQMAHYSFDDYLLVNFWYFIIVSCTISIHLILFPKIFQSKFETIVSSRKGLLGFILSFILLTGIFCFIFKVSFGFYEASLERISTGIAALVAFGLFPLLFFIPFGSKFKLRSISPNEIAISGKTGFVRLSELLYIHSDKNYVVWVFKSDGEIKRIRVRETLTSVEKRLFEHPEIKRTHRAYLVNASKIESIKNNHSAYSIHLSELEEIVPLSRSYRDKF